jgi:DNA-binding IclR family transcriptional regulator
VEDKETRSSIQVIDRMMKLLEILAANPAPMNLKLLAAETRLHPSTAHRILNVMVGNRMIDRVEPGTYRLGMRLLELGTLVRSRISVLDEALPFMRELQRDIGETVNLSVRKHDEVIFIERTAPDNQMMRVVQAAGSRMPLHITAAGKIFLAADGAELCLEYAKRTGLPKLTANTLADAAALAKDLERVRQHGYAFDNEEAEKGVSCAAAGIYGDDGRLVAALSVSAPSERFTKTWAEAVRQMAERISRALGYQRAGNG